MSRIARIVVLATALASLFAIAASTAGAVTWHNTGATAFHATGGAVSLAVTGSGGTNLLTCTGSTLTGDAPLGSTVSAVYNVKGTLTFSPCTLAGNASYWHCGFTWTGTAQPSADVTLGNADLTCDMRLASTSTALCHLAGTTPVHYVNPSGSAVGRFTWTASSTLVLSHASGTSCSAFLGSNTSGIAHLAHRTDSLTGSGPILTRTA